jgi:putative ABC transport system permease protein
MLLHNLRYGFRLAGRKPAFALVAVFILALGIAVNSAMFSVLNTLLFHAVPYRDAPRILAIYQANPERGVKQQLVSIPDYFDWRRDNPAFDGLAAWNFQYFNLSGADQPERVQGLKITADFFDILGVAAALGRAFPAENEQPGRDNVVILSDGLWKRRFGGDAAIIGRSILIENQPHTVVGVLPADFRLFRVLNRELDLFVPLAINPVRASRADHLLFVYAKLKAGTSLAQARLMMDTVTGRVAAEHPDTSAGWRAELVQLEQQWTSGSRSFLIMAQIAIGFVLLIACANITGLLLAHAVGRRHEMAIRIALGASRSRLIAQLLAESSILGALSTAAGTALAFGLIGALNGLPYNALNRVEPFRLDGTVLAFNVAAGLLTGLLAGLAPALQASALNLRPDLVRGRRTYNLLIASEAALAVVLLAGAGLLVRSSLLVSGMKRGLDAHNLLTAQVWLPAARYPDGPRIARFWRQLIERVSVLPGVRSASAVNFLPLSVLGTSFGVLVDGKEPVRPGEEPQAQYWVIGPDYFRTASIPLLEGRAFTEQDNDEAHGVVIVSATMARRFWPGQSALGKRLRPLIPDTGHYWLPKSQNRPLTVVGIAGDIKLDGIAQNAPPQMYLPYAQNPSSIFHLLVRTADNPERLSSAVRQAVMSMDKDQPVFDEKSLEDVLASSVARVSMVTRGLAITAVIALLLACVGIYGVTSYIVSQRSRETGIRMALGANPRRLVGLQVRRTMSVVLIGSAAGVAGALAGTRVLKSMLVGVSTTDIVTLSAAPLFFLLIAALATWLPAHRAAQVDPLTALRHD